MFTHGCKIKFENFISIAHFKKVFKNLINQNSHGKMFYFYQLFEVPFEWQHLSQKAHVPWILLLINNESNKLDVISDSYFLCDLGILYNRMSRKYVRLT